MAWVATFVVLIAAVRHFAGDDEPRRPLTAAVRESPHARLVDLVADRPHVVAVRNIEHLAPGMILPSACAEPAISSVVPTAISTGTRDAGGLLPRHQPARAAQAGRQRAAIAAGLVGEGAKGPPHRIGDVLQRRRLQRCRDVFAGAAALDQADADAAENRRAQPLRLLRAPAPPSSASPANSP